MKALVGLLVKDNKKVYLQSVVKDTQNRIQSFWHEQQTHAKALTDEQVALLIGEVIPYLSSVNNCYFITLPDDFVQAPFEVVHLS